MYRRRKLEKRYVVIIILLIIMVLFSIFTLGIKDGRKLTILEKSSVPTPMDTLEYFIETIGKIICGKQR